jgi:predicted component of type VI protein secretion system
MTPAQRREAAAQPPAARLRSASAEIRDLHQDPDDEAEAMYWRNLAALLDDTADAIETDGIGSCSHADQLLISLAEGYLLAPWLDDVKGPAAL